VLSRYFIDRPIFAWVIAILVTLTGAVALSRLPIARYPIIAPPTISVTASYPGASAKVAEESVTQIIEQGMTGLDGLLYMSSSSASSGAATVQLTFASGTNPDIAQVQVQNKLQSVTPLLPAIVQQNGITVSKAGSAFLMIVGLVAESSNLTKTDLADFAATHLVEPLSRVNGVGDVHLFQAKYAMRIWLDADKLKAYSLTPGDITSAVNAQNAQVSLGALGGTPAVPGQQLTATVTSQGRLHTPAEFSNIVVRALPSGQILRLGDVARVEIGAEAYTSVSRFNGQPAVGMAISLSSTANALQTAKDVQTLIEDLKPTFPAGVRLVFPFDTTPFVRASIRDVLKTLGEAIVLVFLVMYLFLQNIRATLIPTIAVPIVLFGTFGVLAALGYSVNMLTMFAMVLAIGLLVDDAIVVVENVERVMSEEGLSPLEATRKSMDQITGALVGIAVVLAAVFLPMAFLEGSSGAIYRQFSVTIVSAMVLSVLVALILTPALCATLLKPIAKGEHLSERGFFGRFNHAFDARNLQYQGFVRRLIGLAPRTVAVYGGITVVMLLLFWRLPTTFLPGEDQGSFFTIVQAPVGATQERTLKTLSKVEDYYLNREKDTIDSLFTVQGFSFAGGGQNSGMAFIMLKKWEDRTKPEQQIGPLIKRAFGGLSQIKDAMVIPIAPPALPELGNVGGVSFYLRDENGQGHEALLAARNELLGKLSKSKLLVGVRPNGQEDSAQFRVDIDTAHAASLGVSIADLNNTLSVAWGGRYIDDFIDRGRVKRVYLQADAPFRMNPSDFARWSVRNASGAMVPISAFATTHWTYGPSELVRYNGVPAMQLNGDTAPGASSGDAMAEVLSRVGELPPGFRVAWAGQSYEERAAGSQRPTLYALSLIVIFLCLSALYESWTIPVAILLAVPLGVVGAVLATSIRGLESDIYFQVGMLTTIGLASKNAILIVEFAEAHRRDGMELVAATLAAIRDRLRPILMTSLAFGLGVMPLAIATGAGAGAQRAIGTGVVGGVLAGTVLGVVFIPVLYVSVMRLAAGRKAPVSV
jgi:multidrug efflux pump